MDDLEKYVKSRFHKNSQSQKDFEQRYSEFKIGVFLRSAREKAGLTQDAIAEKLHTKKTAISRLENHADDTRLSTLYKYANALGKTIKISIV